MSSQHSSICMPFESTTSQPKQNRRLPIPWGKEAKGPTFNHEYPTVFRKSQIPNGGKGWWALVDIPANTMLRTVSVKDGTLLRFANEEELRATGWALEEAGNYGIAHKSDRDCIFYLNPGTMMNHADPTRRASARYCMSAAGQMEILTTRAVRKGEEIFNDYEADFSACPWFDELMLSLGRASLCKLGSAINEFVTGPEAASGAVKEIHSFADPRGVVGASSASAERQRA